MIAQTDRQRALPMFAICVGVLLLPWGRAPRSGILGEGKYALALALTGLLIYTLVASGRLDLTWWRITSVPLALGCLALALHVWGAKTRDRRDDAPICRQNRICAPHALAGVIVGGLTYAIGLAFA